MNRLVLRRKQWIFLAISWTRSRLVNMRLHKIALWKLALFHPASNYIRAFYISWITVTFSTFYFIYQGLRKCNAGGLDHIRFHIQRALRGAGNRRKQKFQIIIKRTVNSQNCWKFFGSCMDGPVYCSCINREISKSFTMSWPWLFTPGVKIFVKFEYFAGLSSIALSFAYNDFCLPSAAGPLILKTAVMNRKRRKILKMSKGIITWLLSSQRLIKSTQSTNSIIDLHPKKTTLLLYKPRIKIVHTNNTFWETNINLNK